MITGEGVMNKQIKEFDDFPEAFDYCRERDKPVIVKIQGKEWKLYPSGYAKNLARNKVESK